eukprot:gene3804-4385_t
MATTHREHTTRDINQTEVVAKLPLLTALVDDLASRKIERAAMSQLITTMDDNAHETKRAIVEHFKELQYQLKQQEMNLLKEITASYGAPRHEIFKKVMHLDKELDIVEPMANSAAAMAKESPESLYHHRYQLLEYLASADSMTRQMQSDAQIVSRKPLTSYNKFSVTFDPIASAKVTEAIQGLGLITVTPVPIVMATPKDYAPIRSPIQAPAGGGPKAFYAMGGWNEHGTDVGALMRMDIEKNEWRVLKPMPEVTPFISSSCVSDGKNIYVFGGSYSMTTYRRYNISKAAWDKTPERLVRGGAGIAAVYDGRKYIYVFGGKVFEESKPYHQIVHRIERLNVATKTIDYLASMSKHKYGAHPCYDGSRYIYIVGGQIVNGRACKEIERFDTQDNKSTVYISLGGGGLVQGAVIDVRGDAIYYLTQTHFKRFNIASKTFETLDLPPLTSRSCRPTMITDHHTRIYLFDQHDNYYFDIPSAKWTQFANTKKLALCGQGMVSSLS